MSNKKTVTSISEKITLKIEKQGRGWCFTTLDFSDLGNESAVRKVLSRLEKKNKIRRVIQGIYEYPRIHHELGVLPPQVKNVVTAFAEKNGVKLQPAGAYAANLIGLSEQVPGKIIFLTNGQSKKMQIGWQEIQFKTTTEKNMHSAGTKVGLLIQALKNIGKNGIDDNIKLRIKRYLKSISQKELKTYIKYAPVWIRSIVYDIKENNL